MSTFRKSPACPLSNDLLAFQAGRLAKQDRDAISAHVNTCDFCAAETEFYAHYPQTEESIERAEMPPALRELAEALLVDRSRNVSILRSLFFSRKGPTTAGC